jgi:hypothetical protein
MLLQFNVEKIQEQIENGNKRNEFSININENRRELELKKELKNTELTIFYLK